jgi:hypothetical protein
MRCYQKVPGLGQKINAGLIYTILAAISFKSYLGNIYNDPIVFSTLQKAPWKSLSLMLSGTTCDSLWMPDVVSKRRPFTFIFNLGNKVKTQGPSLVSRGDGEG